MLRKGYRFIVQGKVKAKQSMKFKRIGQFVKTYTPDDVVEYANWVKCCFLNEYPDAKPSDLEGYTLSISIYVYYRYPKSFSKKKLSLAKQGVLRPTIKPDWDNIGKNICDALNNVAYIDDKSIVAGEVQKFYSDDDYVSVELRGYKYEQ